MTSDTIASVIIMAYNSGLEESRQTSMFMVGVAIGVSLSLGILLGFLWGKFER